MSFFATAGLTAKVNDTLKKVDDQVTASRQLQDDLDEAGSKLDPSHAAAYYGEDLDDDEDGVDNVIARAKLAKASCEQIEKDIKSLSTVFTSQKANQLHVLAQLPQPKLLQAIPKIPDQAYFDMIRIVTNKEKTLVFLAELSDAHRALLADDLRTFVKPGPSLVDRTLREASIVSSVLASDVSTPVKPKNRAMHQLASQQASQTKSSKDWQLKYQVLLKEMEDLKRDHARAESETRISSTV